jgi:hypothetical protein
VRTNGPRVLVGLPSRNRAPSFLRGSGLFLYTPHPFSTADLGSGLDTGDRTQVSTSLLLPPGVRLCIHLIIIIFFGGTWNGTQGLG